MAKRSGQAGSAAVRDPSHVTQRLGQLKGQQVDFAGGPGTRDEYACCVTEEFCCRVQLGELGVVGDAGEVAGAVTDEIARLAVRLRPRQQPHLVRRPADHAVTALSPLVVGSGPAG
ncbi:hypothetical protein IPZ61_26615 [Streptomyces sioyaensis]|uniref:hypothetical protein n=1 Tax=Streptomyces sioyaensis TaxID=67364 RepID=UPI0027E57424|nr:hypothetical protein [Streptomyces sioyaensis]MCF3176880.1 hypothetical protein [Streptomyces sioyaensis]